MTSKTQKISKLLVANRGEIAIRVFRAASELSIRTVAIYTYEDRYSLHRYKADEAYQIGHDSDSLKPYLDIDAILKIAKHEQVDAIHPGYGFLSENVEFARACQQAGLIFIGPQPEVMQRLGDKIEAKAVAKKAKVPIIEDSKEKLISLEIALKEAERIGFPVMVKAAAGGGGRGMRVVQNATELEKAFQEARSEAKNAFGNDTLFLEKYIQNPKHIEVQIMGDNYGNLVHLYERDCSVQRRFQKVVEVAPCYSIKKTTKTKLYRYALSIAREVNYNNVGTIEFLVDQDEAIYFIEVNPRIQVEHTITEEITKIDIVRSQIQIARGYALHDPQIFIRQQEDIPSDGFAVQCRITTEDPRNGFKPDYGTILAYRSAGGFGIRLDVGNCYTGVKVSPFFDSMLVKISASGRTLKGATQRLHRALREFRIRGVKTNIGFLENVITHPTFYSGQATTKFIDEHPELFKIGIKFDRGTKMLKYLADISVNGHPDVRHKEEDKKFQTPLIPEYDRFAAYPKGTKTLLSELGPDKFVEWLKHEKKIHYTDTTFRDAHQSLLATRVRSFDMLQIAEGFAKNHSQVFSMEVWGGATFDVCYRFLKEDPWVRLQKLREAIPNILLQMLLRGSNAVGYTAYPDNLIGKFIETAWENGIDVFRIFDSLNWVDNMLFSIKTVRERTPGLAEAAICYTGNILDKNSKYNVTYYTDIAKRLEDAGAHILAIKDMAGLLKPYAAEILIPALKDAVSLPIHLHTHDTAAVQTATYLKAIEADVDIIDVALNAMSGLTSQPGFNSMVACLQGHQREQYFDLASLNRYSNYWEYVREYYYPFESGLKAGTAEVYDHEIPGGQYSNLRPQAQALGLADKFEDIKRNYALVNQMFGDIVKVTPSSKVVGDMALFMTANNLTPEDIRTRGHSLSFPDSVVGLFRGDLGQPYGGFPVELSQIILKNEKPLDGKPNQHLEAIDFEPEFENFKKTFDDRRSFLEFLSYKLYPKVYEDYFRFLQEYGQVEYLPTRAFFYGMKPNEEQLVTIAKGKTLIVELHYISAPDESGYRTVSFALNGQTRQVNVRDNAVKVKHITHRKAESENHIGAPLQGKLAKINVRKGDQIKLNTSLFVIEAMKMETNVAAPRTGKIKHIHLDAGVMVEQDDLIIEFE